MSTSGKTVHIGGTPRPWPMSSANIGCLARACVSPALMTHHGRISARPSLIKSTMEMHFRTSFV
eukprot:3691567-Prymnesium_polylepis.1